MRIAPLVAAVLAVAVAAAPASGAEPKTSLPDVEDEVMCVTCNVPLNIAESPQADAQREEVRRLVAQGLTKEQVKDRLVAQYGEDVLALPEEDGVGAAAYLVPIAVVLGMLALAAVVLPRWRRRAPAPLTTGGATASEAELKRLDEDLARYE